MPESDPSFWSRVPIAVWFLLVVLLGALLQYLRLRFAAAHQAAAGREAERAVEQSFEALQRYGETHGSWPRDLLEVDAAADGVAYRCVPGPGFDPRLVVLYDRLSRHRLINFPQMRRGRAACLVSGKMLIMTEDQFEKLVYADNGLRENLGLESLAIESGGEKEEKTS